MAAVFKEGVEGNYEPKNLEPRTGPGEGGVPVHLSSNEKAAGEQSVREYGFNMVVSDKISLDRRIKDTRPQEYLFKLFKLIVKINFHIQKGANIGIILS